MFNNLKKLFLSDQVIKIFHNAVFDVSFLMENLNLNSFGLLVCTKISSKIVNGLAHNNTLKALVSEYLGIQISKEERQSDWTQELLSESQKIYAINDVKYLYPLWNKLRNELIENDKYAVATNCFDFIPTYKVMTDMGIDNIFNY